MNAENKERNSKNLSDRVRTSALRARNDSDEYFNFISRIKWYNPSRYLGRGSTVWVHLINILFYFFKVR